MKSYQLNPDLIFKKTINGEYVLTFMSGKTMLKLEDCDADVFDLIVQHPEFTHEELKNGLLDEFETEGLSLEAYLQEFLEILVNHQVIKER